MYISREHLEAYSPSREHGICARLEATFRWSYCDFLKDVGIELKMYDVLTLCFLFPSWIYFFVRPQLTIATAVVFCHRFYARHSHGLIENDRFVSCAVPQPICIVHYAYHFITNTSLVDRGNCLPVLGCKS
jgi:cyclin T